MSGSRGMIRREPAHADAASAFQVALDRGELK